MCQQNCQVLIVKVWPKKVKEEAEKKATAVQARATHSGLWKWGTAEELRQLWVTRNWELSQQVRQIVRHIKERSYAQAMATALAMAMPLAVSFTVLSCAVILRYLSSTSCVLTFLLVEYSLAARSIASHISTAVAAPFYDYLVPGLWHLISVYYPMWTLFHCFKASWGVCELQVCLCGCVCYNLPPCWIFAVGKETYKLCAIHFFTL